MRRLRAIWQPSTVSLVCAWCMNKMQEITLSDVKSVGNANLACRKCRGINVLPSDLVRQSQSAMTQADPDNPPGRAETWDMITGNIVLKRAMEIAIVGYHTLCYVGNPDIAWPLVATILGPRATIMQRCPCGNFMNTHTGQLELDKACFCTLEEIKEHRATTKFAEAYLSDLIVEVVPSTHEDVFAYTESYTSVLERIRRVRFDQQFWRASMDIRPNNNPAFDLLNDARKRWQFTQRLLVSTQRVAMTIAEMDGQEIVTPTNMAEALSFRTPLLLQT